MLINRSANKLSTKNITYQQFYTKIGIFALYKVKEINSPEFEGIRK